MRFLFLLPLFFSSFASASEIVCFDPLAGMPHRSEAARRCEAAGQIRWSPGDPPIGARAQAQAVTATTPEYDDKKPRIIECGTAAQNCTRDGGNPTACAIELEACLNAL